MPKSEVLKELLEANAEYAGSFEWSKLPISPAKEIAVLTRIDARIDEMLGLREGDALEIRNAVGIAAEPMGKLD